MPGAAQCKPLVWKLLTAEKGTAKKLKCLLQDGRSESFPTLLLCHNIQVSYEAISVHFCKKTMNVYSFGCLSKLRFGLDDNN